MDMWTALLILQALLLPSLGISWTPRSGTSTRSPTAICASTMGLKTHWVALPMWRSAPKR
ncbi:ACP5 isoform 9 [Pongo abelii]|uniref:ACP5 isoform 9 n=1 Tax=Pongo abelii TaxID=9601 RepID=A0A2J8RYJ2_PONAB|nr:ACP5 isoform 9 [Pongo abelii]